MEQLRERDAEGGREPERRDQSPIWTMGPRGLVEEQGRDFEQSPRECLFSGSGEGEDYDSNLEWPPTTSLENGKSRAGERPRASNVPRERKATISLLDMMCTEDVSKAFATVVEKDDDGYDTVAVPVEDYALVADAVTVPVQEDNNSSTS